MSTSVDKKFFADNGFVHESGTAGVTGSFYALYVYPDAGANFSAITAPKASGDAITGITFPKGTIIPGPITAFTLTSGAVFALKNEPAPFA